MIMRKNNGAITLKDKIRFKLASNQEKRAELMPIANAYSITQVLEACKYYFEKTGRRITFEYSLVGGKNDSQEDAKERQN